MAMQDYAGILADLREFHHSGASRDLRWRRVQLEGLRALIRENEERIFEALAADLHKCRVESYLTETGFVLGELSHALHHLEAWARPTHPATPVLLKPGGSTCLSEPLGVALIIGPWNFPVELTLAPLVGCLAAGNCAIVKPSEYSTATGPLIAELMPHYLDPRAVAVVQGGVPETTELLKLRFDRIFFTGSARVGRIVMEAAAKHLTPVTLELGGKCPCYVDRSANLDVAARRVAGGKFTNAGQTCVAPDYVLADEAIAGELVADLIEAVGAFYGPDPRESEDYARIATAAHHQRLVALLADAEIAVGGEQNEQDLYIAPTIIYPASADCAAMQEEIFGPILPVIEVANVEEAIRFIADGPRPLVIYVFAEDPRISEQIVHRTTSGGVSINETLLQMLVPDLPFGGVGESGMGRYHGESGFREFSNLKAVFERSTYFDPSIRYPPFTPLDETLFRHMRG